MGQKWTGCERCRPPPVWSPGGHIGRCVDSCANDKLAQDAPGFELGVGALARDAEPGVSPVGLFLGGGLVPLPVRGADPVLAEVALIAQDDQAAGGQGLDDAPDPGRGQVVDGAGQRPGHPHDVAVGAGDDLQVHPVLAVLAGVGRPVGGDPVDGN